MAKYMSEIQVGDQLVKEATGYALTFPDLVTVVKVTKTQVTVQSVRGFESKYSRTSLIGIGQIDSYRPDRLCHVHGKTRYPEGLVMGRGYDANRDHLMWGLEEYETEIERLKEKKAKQVRCNTVKAQIRNLPEMKWLSEEHLTELEAVLTKIEIEREEKAETEKLAYEKQKIERGW